jgi:hypothetical protein
MNNAVGFTGTQAGMTGDQITTVARLLQRFYKHELGTEFHHGGEPHSDAEAALIAEGIGYLVIVHEGGTPAQNIARNHDIVNVSGIMIAAPRGNKEIVRSGTWATIRYACGMLNYACPGGGSRPLVIVWPDGVTDYRNFV